MKTSRKIRTAKTKLFLIGCGASLLMTFGCSKDSPINPLGGCFAGNWAEQYANELTDWTNAATAYSADPTPANCSKYKTSAKNYLDALREVAKCMPTADRSEINASINEAKAEVDKEGCD